MVSRLILCGFVWICGVQPAVAQVKGLFLREIEWKSDAQARRTYTLHWGNTPSNIPEWFPIETEQAVIAASFLGEVAKLEGWKVTSVAYRVYLSKDGSSTIAFPLTAKVPPSNHLISVYCGDRIGGVVTYKLTFEDTASLKRVQEIKVQLETFVKEQYKAQRAIPDTQLVDGKTAILSFKMEGKMDWLKD